MNYSIGIDLGGSNIAAGILDEKYNLISKQSVPTEPERGFSCVLDKMTSLIDALCQSSSILLSDISSIGIGVPGSLSQDGRSVSLAVNLGWKNVSLAPELQKKLQNRPGLQTDLTIPVFLANDADCAALAETFCGAARGYKSAVIVTIGTGIGTGVVSEDSIFPGFSGYGTEGGHISICMDGELCSCGRRGCWEAYASSTALKKQTIRAMEKDRASKMWEICGGDISNASAKTPFAAAKLSDKTALGVIESYTGYLAAGISSIINLLRPEIILIGGGVSNEGDFLIVSLQKKVCNMCYAPDIIPAPPIKRAALGNDAGIVGAALLNK